MDAFLARVSYHATSYAIRSCFALTSTLVIQQGSKLLKTVDDQPLKAELGALQRRLARKIELVSPILESIEFRYTRGNSALEAVVRIGRELREEIDLLVARYQDAAILEEQAARGEKQRQPSAQERHAELLSILAETKQLMASIDDLLPSINLWVSAMGGIQPEAAAFSPSRLLQASMLVNVGDTQFVLNPNYPMQIGPDFTLSLYMLFRGHASAQDGEAYGVEEGQRKPMWQEVIHKARVRLYRTSATVLPGDETDNGDAGPSNNNPGMGYAYQLQIVEDLDDGRVHTFENGNIEPGPYDGVSLAGVRDVVPVGQISKMFYADVGRILNINHDDGASSNPVLLLKRDVSEITRAPTTDTCERLQREQSSGLIESVEESDCVSESTLSEHSPQDEIDRQLREESQAVDMDDLSVVTPDSGDPSPSPWTIPHNLDPEWIALEVFDIDDESESSDEEELEPLQEEIGHASSPRSSQSPPPRTSKAPSTIRTSVDSNLVSQLQRMRIGSEPGRSRPRPSSSSHADEAEDDGETILATSTELVRQQSAPPLSPTTIERSPFSAIKTSLSLLEMLLRLTSLQEFEQVTHLSIPDHVLRFYLDESASESGLYGKERWAARAEAARKMGFDPYVDGPGGGPGGM